MMAVKLDFVIGGAQKAGTSTIDAYLRSHPEIGMARIKETHFFDNETLNWLAHRIHDGGGFGVAEVA
jgi:hypothetical protein